ncbi:MAG: 50S ribosomal protein L5 [Candidatus Omnitrophica bacterium]|nr:50S ribosomal protein L5 [Candidatus Omnitrophota bacterium]
MTILKDRYQKQIVPQLVEKFGYNNRMQVPGLDKIVVNVGLGEMAHQKELIESVRDELAQITAQRPVLTRAKKSISNFKIRDGAPVGYKVTLRRERMYEFLERLINFVMPRIRDFRGVSRSAFDGNGNYTLGVKEQTIFPELELDKVPITHGMDISFVTTASNREEAMSLLEGFGMPFAKK